MITGNVNCVPKLRLVSLHLLNSAMSDRTLKKMLRLWELCMYI